MNFSRQLAQQTLVAGRDTGAALQMRDLPEDMDGAAVYCRALEFRITGSMTKTAAGPVNFSRIIAAILLQIPGIRPLVNLSGNRLVRMFRVRNAGSRPPAVFVNGQNWQGTGNYTTGDAIDLTFIVEFSSQDGRKLDDHAIPVKLLKAGILKVTVGALTDIAADITAIDLAMDTTFELVRKRELRMPPLPILDAVDQVTGKQPNIDAVEGRITHAFVQPSAEGTFPAGTDLTQLGLGFGSFKLTEDTQSVVGFYDAFNRLATTSVDKHTSTRTDQTAVLPLVFAPGGRNGQHITNEVIPANAKPRLVTDVCANSYALVRRYVLPRSHSEWKTACALCGINPTKPMTASHKPSPSPDVNDYVPAKV